jgi:hypothetical protein
VWSIMGYNWIVFSGGETSCHTRIMQVWNVEYNMHNLTTILISFIFSYRLHSFAAMRSLQAAYF